MAIGLQNQVNTNPPDSSYPNGSIKDNPGNNTGTPFNKRVYDDIHQWFAKLLRLCGITPSGLPDNEYSGFQYLDAARSVFKRPGTYLSFDKSSSLLVSGNLSPLVELLPGAGIGVLSLSDSTSPDELDLGTVLFVNNSGGSINVISQGGDTIDGAPAPYSIGTGDRVEFCIKKSQANWIKIN